MKVISEKKRLKRFRLTLMQYRCLLARFSVMISMDFCDVNFLFKDDFAKQTQLPVLL